MELLKVKLKGELLEVECSICGKSTDSSVGDPVRETIIHIIAEHSKEFSSGVIYNLLRNT